jgi:hypothetical protein
MAEHFFNQRHEAQPPTAARTGQDVDAKRPAHQLGPLTVNHSDWHGQMTVPKGGRPRPEVLAQERAWTA